MNKLLILHGIGFLLFASCVNTSRPKGLKTYLTNDSCKYWGVYLKTPSKPFGIGYCIYDNGSFQRYSTNDSNERVISGAIMFPKPVWQLLNDSTMEFGDGIKCKILYLTKDSLILRNMTHSLHDTLKLFQEFDQKLKLIPKSIKQKSVDKNAFPRL